MRIMFLCGTGGEDVRSTKITGSLVRHGHDVHFVGWRRGAKGMAPSDLDPFHTNVLHWPIFGPIRMVAGQVAFTLFALRNLLAIRPDIVYAVNEDNVLRVALCRRWLYRGLICDLYDGLHERWSQVPGLRGGLLRWLCLSARRLADRIVVTDVRRWGLLGAFQTKAIVVENAPPDPGDPLSREEVSGSIRVFVSGSLHRSRGLPQLLAAVESLADVLIVAAGWAADTFATDTFLTHPKVQFHGQVSPQESLQLAARCDAVFAFYEPKNRNQIYASPNKVFDGMSVGRPILVNAEAKVSQWVLENRLGYACAYHDLGAIALLIQSLRTHRQGLAQFAERARALFRGNYSWEIMEQRLINLINGMPSRH